MAIELPDLVQRIRVKTDEVRAAQKPTKALTADLDKLRASAGDTSNSLDDVDDSTTRYSRSTSKSSKVTDDAVSRMKSLSQSSDDASTSIRSTSEETTRLSGSTSALYDDLYKLIDRKSVV